MNDAMKVMLRSHLLDIDKQIQAVNARAKDLGILPSTLLTSDGNWPMIPLLLAKSQALNALAILSKEK